MTHKKGIFLKAFLFRKAASREKLKLKMSNSHSMEDFLHIRKDIVPGLQDVAIINALKRLYTVFDIKISVVKKDYQSLSLTTFFIFNSGLWPISSFLSRRFANASNYTFSYWLYCRLYSCKSHFAGPIQKEGNIWENGAHGGSVETT